MAKVIERGIPSTLVLDAGEVAAIDSAADQAAALTKIKAAHGLPAHAPVYADNDGQWLDGDSIFVCGRKLPKDGGWYVIRKYPNGLRTARHSTIG